MCEKFLLRRAMAQLDGRLRTVQIGAWTSFRVNQHRERREWCHVQDADRPRRDFCAHDCDRGRGRHFRSRHLLSGLTELFFESYCHCLSLDIAVADDIQSCRGEMQMLRLSERLFWKISNKASWSLALMVL